MPAPALSAPRRPGEQEKGNKAEPGRLSREPSLGLSRAPDSAILRYGPGFLQKATAVPSTATMISPS
jgi:hypothetical protein